MNSERRVLHATCEKIQYLIIIFVIEMWYRYSFRNILTHLNTRVYSWTCKDVLIYFQVSIQVLL